METPLLVGIAGGTGSGKTTAALELVKYFQALGIESVLVAHDNYYRDQAEKSLAERTKTNYDHPDSLETERMAADLTALKNGQTAEIPVYDFAKHARSKKTIKAGPGKLIVAEGILLFTNSELMQMFDLTIYVDTPSDIRFIRRLTRDVAERGRTMESVVEQYMTTVRPMHEKFVEPTKKLAEIILPEGGYNKLAMGKVIEKIEEKLRS